MVSPTLRSGTRARNSAGSDSRQVHTRKELAEAGSAGASLAPDCGTQTMIAAQSSSQSRPTLVRAATPDECDAFAEASSDRRAHRRMIISELSWLNHVKLKYGPEVSLIDLSSHGAQIETSGRPLKPGSTVVIEVAMGERWCAVPSEVLRCHIAGLAPNARYRGALRFKRPFDFPDEAGTGRSGRRRLQSGSRIRTSQPRLEARLRAVTSSRPRITAAR